jgi:hypothetical protein
LSGVNVPVVLQTDTVNVAVPERASVVVSIPAMQGPASKYAEYSTTFTYDINGRLQTTSNVGGTKTFYYTDGNLTSIVGTGRYPSKNFTYNAGILSFVEVL